MLTCLNPFVPLDLVQFKSLMYCMRLEQGTQRKPTRQGENKTLLKPRTCLHQGNDKVLKSRH